MNITAQNANPVGATMSRDYEITMVEYVRPNADKRIATFKATQPEHDAWALLVESNVTFCCEKDPYNPRYFLYFNMHPEDEEAERIVFATAREIGQAIYMLAVNYGYLQI